MTEIIVSRDCWFNCFTEACDQRVIPAYQYLQDIYGIVNWRKMDNTVDRYEIIFDDEKKMAYWILRWA